MMKKYWAFISYSSDDSEHAEWLHRSLEKFPIPNPIRGSNLKDGTRVGRHLRPIFRDRTELPAAGRLDAAIRRALDESRYLIVLCSRTAAQSYWVNQEVEYFIEQQGVDRVLAIILDGKRNTTETDENGIPLECFPRALRHPIHPLAADLRPGGDGRKNGLIKVLAGALEVGFDDLARRHRAATNRLRAVVGVVSAISISFLAVLVIRMRDADRIAGDAVLQAEQARQAQEQQRQIADDLAGKWFPGDQAVPEVAKLILTGQLGALQEELSPEQARDLVLGQEEMTPLMLAAATGRVEIARWLLSLGMDPEQQNPGGETALTFAAFYGQSAMIDLLQTHGVDLDRANTHGQRPLDIAVSAKNYDFIRKLIEAGVPIERAPEQEEGVAYPSSLYYALQDEQALRLLVDLGADVQYGFRGVSVMNSARYVEDFDAVAILQQGRRGQSPEGLGIMLHHEMQALISDSFQLTPEKVAKVKDIVEQGADVDYRVIDEIGVDGTALGYVMLYFAKSKSPALMVDLIEMLIEAGADSTLLPKDADSVVVEYTRLPMFVASIQESPHGIQALELLVRGMRDHRQGTAALRNAIRFRKVAFCRILVEGGLGADLILDNGNSLLGGLIMDLPENPGYRSMIDELVERWSDVNFINPEGDALLHLAAARGDARLVNRLIERGADVELRHFEGASPLIVAAHFGNEDTLRALLQAGAVQFYSIGEGAAKRDFDAMVVAEKAAQVECLGILFEARWLEIEPLFLQLAERREADPNDAQTVLQLANLHYQVGRIMVPGLLNDAVRGKRHLEAAKRQFVILRDAEVQRTGEHSATSRQLLGLIRDCEQRLSSF